MRLCSSLVCSMQVPYQFIYGTIGTKYRECLLYQLYNHHQVQFFITLNVQMICSRARCQCFHTWDIDNFIQHERSVSDFNQGCWMSWYQSNFGTPLEQTLCSMLEEMWKVVFSKLHLCDSDLLRFAHFWCNDRCLVTSITIPSRINLFSSCFVDCAEPTEFAYTTNNDSSKHPTGDLC